MELKKRVNIQKVFKDGAVESCTDEVLIEYVFSIYINGSLLVELLALPLYLNELVIGYLYTEKVINSLSDIKKLIIDKENAKAFVEVDVKSNNESVVTTDSGDYRKIPYQFYDPKDIKPLIKNELDTSCIIDNFASLMNGSELFKNTGNVHSVLLCKGKDRLYFREDIGRYNAFDKAIGSALLDGVDLSKCIIYTSGRIPSTIAMKAIRAGVTCIVSRSAPSDKTLDVAKKYNLGVIGFTTRDKFNIYNVQL